MDILTQYDVNTDWLKDNTKIQFLWVLENGTLISTTYWTLHTNPNSV